MIKKLLTLIGICLLGAVTTSGTIKSTSNDTFFNQSNDIAQFDPSKLRTDHYFIESNNIQIWCDKNKNDFAANLHNGLYTLQPEYNWEFYKYLDSIATFSEIQFVLDGEGELIEDGTSFGTITRLGDNITWKANDNQIVPGVKIKNASSTSEIKFKYVNVTFQKTAKLSVISEDENKGTVTGGNDQAIISFTYELTATPKEGYSFKGWAYKDTSYIASTDNPWTYKFEQATTIIAKFEESFCDVYLTADPTGGGTVTGGGINIPNGTIITLTASPNPGYNFLGFYDGDTLLSSTSPYEYTVTASKNLTAKFQIQTFTVVWKNYDGTVLETDNDVPYGSKPSYDGATPTKEGTAQYTYEFSGWNPDISSAVVTSDQTYTAKYKEVTNKYTVTFKNYDDSILQTGLVEYGKTPEYEGSKPTKPSTAQYEYSFAGWDHAISTVTSDQTYTAQFNESIRQYTITFKNYDGTTLQSGKLDYGATPSYSGATPTRPSTAEYTYTFTGWDPSISTVTGNQTYTAQYSSTKNKYTITWLMDDGTLIDTTEVEYGDMPTHHIAVKPSTEQYEYPFTGWYPEVTTVTGNATYTATFEQRLRKYAIYFKNWNGDVLQGDEFEYGATPVYRNATPTKPSTAQYSYTFTGWSPKIVPVTGHTVYTAQFNEVVNKYSVKFVNDDGTVLQESKVEYGVTPSYAGLEPTKPSTAQYSYSFAGWDKDITSVTGDVTYTATYKSTLRDYEIVFKNDDGTTLQSSRVNYGETPSYTGSTPIKPETKEYTYTFAGWDHAISAVTGDDTYIARYNATKQKYYVCFVNYDGSELQTTQYEYGELPSYDRPTPTKEPTKTGWHWEFTGWDKPIEKVTEAITYTAQFKEVKNKYTVTWLNDDDTTLMVDTVEYQDTPLYKGPTPTKKPKSETEAYEFAGWDKEITPVTDNVIYKATYKEVVRKYDVIFNMGGHGSQIETLKVEYNTLVSEPTTPTANGFTFDGWYKDSEYATKFDFANEKIDKDTTIYAKWNKNSSGAKIAIIVGSSIGGAATIGTASILIIRRKRKII